MNSIVLVMLHGCYSNEGGTLTLAYLFITVRMEMEDDYAKKLVKLAKSLSSIDQETGYFQFSFNIQ